MEDRSGSLTGKISLWDIILLLTENLTLSVILMVFPWSKTEGLGLQDLIGKELL